LRPLGRALQLAALHVVERDRSGIAIFAHPEAGELRDVFGSQEAPQLETVAGEIDRDHPGERTEGAWTLIVSLDTHCPLAAVNSLSINHKGTGRPSAPPRGYASGVLGLEIQSSQLRSSDGRLAHPKSECHDESGCRSDQERGRIAHRGCSII